MIGRFCGEQIVVIERGPASNFAKALGDSSPEYQDRQAAVDAGFAEVPAPPTFPFVMQHWGVRRELLDEYGIEPVPRTAFTGVADQLGHIAPVMQQLTDELGPGLVLHAEQEFDYHRTPMVGDVLRGSTTIVDVFTKPSTDRVLTFVVIETAWTDAASDDPVVTCRFTAVHQPSQQARIRPAKAGST
jgi:hypothetical protein